jgi:hypothetical protein
MEQSTQKQERQTISQQEFDKKVDMAFGYMTYVERMSEKEARVKAKQEVSEKFYVGQM